MENFSTTMTVSFGQYYDIDIFIEAEFSATEHSETIEVWGALQRHSYWEIEDVKIISIVSDGDYLDENDKVVFDDGDNLTEMLEDAIIDKLWDKINEDGL